MDFWECLLLLARKPVTVDIVLRLFGLAPLMRIDFHHPLRNSQYLHGHYIVRYLLSIDKLSCDSVPQRDW